MEKVIKLILPCTIVPFSIYQDGLIKIYNFFKGQNLQLWKEKEGIISPDVFLSMRYHLDSIIQLHLKIAPIETLKNCIDAYSSSLEKLQVSLKGMLNEFYIFLKLDPNQSFDSIHLAKNISNEAKNSILLIQSFFKRPNFLLSLRSFIEKDYEGFSLHNAQNSKKLKMLDQELENFIQSMMQRNCSRILFLVENGFLDKFVFVKPKTISYFINTFETSASLSILNEKQFKSIFDNFTSYYNIIEGDILLRLTPTWQEHKELFSIVTMSNYNEFKRIYPQSEFEITLPNDFLFVHFKDNIFSQETGFREFK